MLPEDFYKKLVPLLESRGFSDEQIDDLLERYRDLAQLMVKLYIKEKVKPDTVDGRSPPEL